MASEFDEKAATWDDPGKVRRGQVVAEAVRATLPVGRTTRVLEYGAGTGLTSQALADHVGPITLAEPSAGMRAVMEDKVRAGTLPVDARIWDLDLSTTPPPDGERFDLVVTVMTLHHIHDLAPVLAGFATFLAGGGHLAVVDLEQEDGSFHATSPGFAGHDGFAHDELTRQLQDAGFTDVQFRPCHEVEKDGATYPLFLATAVIAGR
jgi:predicted TPR repeat methyltransferase